uniref:Uncharacterized protein n=1 Tax=Cryptococcus bacillisporus CA1280 TaxID=1296109 RepID=A0A0D0VC62_CRYGA|nr:hypothetical protein I312_05693 [Cryptococcus bacillisporus CA1280]
MQIIPSHWKSRQPPSKYSTADGRSPTSKESPTTSTSKRTPATTTPRTPAPHAPDKKTTLTPNNASATPKKQKKLEKKDFCAFGKILQKHQNVILEEILQSLIINLKVPSPPPASYLSQMEVFFPAHKMGCIGTKMWRHGMMDDSDAFFGSVLHMIQDCAYKIKMHLALMVIPAIMEAQPLPGFITRTSWPG